MKFVFSPLKFIRRLIELPHIRKILKYPISLLGSILSVFFLIILWLISPFIEIKVGGMIGQRLGHLALNTDLFFRKQQLDKSSKQFIPIFIIGRVANRQLLKMWKRQVIIIESRVLRGLFEYSRWIWEKTNFFEPLDMFSNEYPEFNLANPTLTFTEDEEKIGKEFLRKIGIHPEKDWFVCIFARDPEYLKNEFGLQKDWSYHDYRNADIETYKLAIDYIVGLGGFVIRMGQHVNKALNYDHPHVIDYALTLRTDFMDIYLSSKCRFVLGNTSGIGDLPMIFDRPRICANTAPPTVPPFGKNCLYIPKKIKNLESKQYVTFSRFIEETIAPTTAFEFRGDCFAEKGWEYEDNTAEEILDLTVEMVERLEGRFSLTAEEENLFNCYYQLFPKNHWAQKNKTPIGRVFLRQHQHLFFEAKVPLDSNAVIV